MPTNLPLIFSAGQFHSRDKFSDPIKYPDHSLSRARIVSSYELELFLEDDGLTYLNDRSYSRKKGAVLIAKPGDKRQSTLHFSAIYLHFGCNDPAVQKLIHSICGFHPDLDYDTFAPELLNICNTALDFEPDYDILSGAMLISFLCKIKRNSALNIITNSSTTNYSVVSEAVDYMKKNYMQPLTINNIAEYCHLSTSHFHKIFIETAHITPNNYLLNIRLSHARSLLAATNIPISEIAVKCGFNSQAYFSDCFKRQFASTPRIFRNSFAYPDIDTISDPDKNISDR